MYTYTFQNKAEVTQISLTGSRLIVILGALMTAPRDIQELSDLVIKCGLVDKNYSRDTLRIALSTLKTLGCSLSRPSRATDFKYTLLKHPFQLSLSDEEIKAIRTVYSSLTRESHVDMAIKFNKLLNTLAANVCDDNTAMELLSITSFDKIESDVYEKFVNAHKSQRHDIFTITYSTPAKKYKTCSLVFGKLFLKSNKLYIEGIEVGTNKPVVYNMLRICKVNAISDNGENYNLTAYKIKYKLRNYDHQTLQVEQKVKRVIGNTAVIEAEFANKFFAVQHVLSLGSECTVIAPKEVKNEVIAKLSELRKVYE